MRTGRMAMSGMASPPILLFMLVCAPHTLAEVYPDPAPDCVGKQDEVGCREHRELASAAPRLPEADGGDGTLV